MSSSTLESMRKRAQEARELAEHMAVDVSIIDDREDVCANLVRRMCEAMDCPTPEPAWNHLQATVFDLLEYIEEIRSAETPARGLWVRPEGCPDECVRWAYWAADSDGVLCRVLFAESAPCIYERPGGLPPMVRMETVYPNGVIGSGWLRTAIIATADKRETLEAWLAEREAGKGEELPPYKWGLKMETRNHTMNEWRPCLLTADKGDGMVAITLEFRDGVVREYTPDNFRAPRGDA